MFNSVFLSGRRHVCALGPSSRSSKYFSDDHPEILQEVAHLFQKEPTTGGHGTKQNAVRNTTGRQKRLLEELSANRRIARRVFAAGWKDENRVAIRNPKKKELHMITLSSMMVLH